MPRKSYTCGIYKISTPTRSSSYIGSSEKIERRWSEHKYGLRNKKHHSKRLQNAWNKYQELIFEIIEICDFEKLNEREQFWIDELKPELNTSDFVKNIWLDKDVRKKFKEIHDSSRWRELRRKIANTKNKAWRKVDCSDGRSFENMAIAGRTFGVSTSMIKYLAESQSVGRLGVAFKFHDKEWIVVKSKSEKTWETRRKNGTDKHSENSRKKMSAARKGIAPDVDLVALAIKNSVPVLSIDKFGNIVQYDSVRIAAKAILNGRKLSSVSAQISKCTHGKKKSAYGFVWVKGQKNA